MGVLGILIAFIVFAAVVGGGMLSGDADARAITAIVGTAVGGMFGVLSLPWLIAGVGLVRFKPWARPLGLIVALFDLLLIPVGTLLGIYTIWILMQDETVALFGKCC